MKKITIIVPVHNAENTIERLLSSFISNKDFIQEVILVNDRTTDSTFSKIQPFNCFFKIKIIENEGKQGPGPARKTGILAAQSQWITFVDADDCLTPNSLYYVTKKLRENKNIKLLHTQSIYYESGRFVSEHIAHSDYSCGGNFYDRAYLIQHNLLPHKELFMAEDEYFNKIVIKHIQVYDNINNINRYDYPVYEVHHDREIELSFSFHHWEDYLCKYHLLSTLYYVDFFKKNKNLKQELRTELMNSFIFCFFLYEGIKQNQNMQFNEEDILQTFYQFIKYGSNNFQINQKDFVNYFNNHKIQIKKIEEAANTSIGFKIQHNYSFEKFIQILFEYKD